MAGAAVKSTLPLLNFRIELKMVELTGVMPYFFERYADSGMSSKTAIRLPAKSLGRRIVLSRVNINIAPAGPTPTTS